MREPKEGELWCKYEGGSPFRVINPHRNLCSIEYLHSRLQFYDQEIKATWVPYEPQTEEKEETMTNKLYEITINEETKFGTKLAVNSSGEWVMEIKGTGEVLAVKEDQCQKVVPYSVAIVFLDNKGKKFHYLADKGEFEVGDLLIGGNFTSLAQVKEVDTKNEVATKRFEGWKIQATPIKE